LFWAATLDEHVRERKKMIPMNKIFWIKRTSFRCKA
jgi:hypothetical protein